METNAFDMIHIKMSKTGRQNLDGNRLMPIGGIDPCYPPDSLLESENSKKISPAERLRRPRRRTPEWRRTPEGAILGDVCSTSLRDVS